MPEPVTPRTPEQSPSILKLAVNCNVQIEGAETLGITTVVAPQLVEVHFADPGSESLSACAAIIYCPATRTALIYNRGVYSGNDVRKGVWSPDITPDDLAEYLPGALPSELLACVIVLADDNYDADFEHAEIALKCLGVTESNINEIDVHPTLPSVVKFDPLDGTFRVEALREDGVWVNITNRA